MITFPFKYVHAIFNSTIVVILLFSTLGIKTVEADTRDPVSSIAPQDSGPTEGKSQSSLPSLIQTSKHEFVQKEMPSGFLAPSNAGELNDAIEPLTYLEQKLTSSDAEYDKYCGFSVAVSGDTALVGADNDSIGTNLYQGSAYVFVRSGTTWIQQAKLTASDGAAFDQFGISVAVSGDTALVAAEVDDVGASSDQGSAYVFVRSGATWTQQAKLIASDGAATDYFGVSVAVSGDIALVGAYSAYSDRGSAYVFVRSGTTWTQQAKLIASDGAANDNFGISVAVSGDIALVGAWGDDIGANTDQGSAYIFVRSGTIWTQQAKLTASDGAALDSFGFSVAVSGGTALVGADNDSIGTNLYQGSAYVFVRSGTIWTQQAKLTASDGAANDYFGWVAVSGNMALVGAWADDIGANTDQGSAYIFVRSGTTWTQQAKLIASDGAATDYFGAEVAVSGDTALVGAWGDDIGANTDQGSAYVYESNNTPIGFHVNGRYILDANGNNFIMRGVNHLYAHYINGLSEDQIKKVFSDIKATGANTVRVVLSSGDLEPVKENDATEAANAIQYCKDNHLICVLSLHDTSACPHNESAISLDQAVEFWKGLTKDGKNILTGQEAYVIINIGNEPYGHNINGDPYTEVDAWLPDTQRAIDKMREAGFQHTLMVDAPNCGGDNSFTMRRYAADISDPNVVFSIHMYGNFDDPIYIDDYVRPFRNTNLPLVIGEFGWTHDYGDPDEDSIMRTAQTYGIGYLGWAWSTSKAYEDELDIVRDFDPSQMTGWGNRIIRGEDGICRTSVEASVYDGIQNPTACLNYGDTTGVFRPSNGLLYLKNSNDTGIADMALNYGLPGDHPVVGDWDGNGTATIGVYRAPRFYLRNSNTVGFADIVFDFGLRGDQPIAGDWNGDGVDTIGVYRPSTGQFLLRNINSAGAAHMSFYLGNVGDVGIAGDWDGDGKDTTGVFRPINGIIFLKNTNQTGFADVSLNYGMPGDKPVTGDWDNDGVDTIGVYRNGIFLLRNSNTVGFADISFGLGNPGDMPIAGNWDGQP